MRGYAVALCLGVALAPAVVIGQVPIGPEFQVNVFTTGRQSVPRIASDAMGRFVVAWNSQYQDGSGDGVFARRYDATGAPIGTVEFRVNAYITGSQSFPDVAAAPDGRTFFTWHGQDGSGSGILARRFDAEGTSVGGEFRVNSYTTGAQALPSIAADGNGNLVVVWTSSQDGSPNGVFGQRHDGDGVAQGTEFQVNSYTTGNQVSRQKSVASSANGRFVVVWDSGDQDGDARGIFAQRFDPAGVAAGSEFRVNVSTLDTQFGASVAADAGGNFVVVWHGFAQPGGDTFDIFGRRYDASGVPLGGEFMVNTDTVGYQTYASVAMDARGGFFVAWQGPGQHDPNDVFVREFDRLGPAGVPLRVGAYTGEQTLASVTAITGGDFVVAWTGEDGGGSGIFARRFRPDLIFRDGFETGDLSAWSANVTDGGDLSVNSTAALDSTLAGLHGVVDDTAALYVQDDSPDDEPRYRARFWIDPNGFDPGVAQGHLRTRVFIAFSEAPTRRVAAVVLRRQSGVYSLMARARLDDNSQMDTGFFAISDGPHAVEIDLIPATGPDAFDGSIQLHIDGELMVGFPGLDNSLGAVDFVRLGALSVKAGATGTLYWDEFESRRQGAINP